MTTAEKNKKIAKKINELLFDYDLKETDDNCLNNISGALLDMFLWARRSKF